MKSDETQFAWLIENVRLTTYWDGRGLGTFTRDPNDAVRFSRQEDADRIAHWLMSKEPVVAREHGWFAAPADPQPEAPSVPMEMDALEIVTTHGVRRCANCDGIIMPGRAYLKRQRGTEFQHLACPTTEGTR